MFLFHSFLFVSSVGQSRENLAGVRSYIVQTTAVNPFQDFNRTREDV